MINCCIAILFTACSCADENNAPIEHDLGVVFQIQKLSDMTSEDKSFSDKNELKTYIYEIFSEDYYFCVFEDNERVEIFDNVQSDGSIYLNHVDLSLHSDECFIVYNLSNNSISQEYILIAGMPTTTNSKSSMELKVGVNKNYNITANIIPVN